MAKGKQNRPPNMSGQAVELGTPRLSVGAGADVNIIVRQFHGEGFPAYAISRYPHPYAVRLSQEDLATMSAEMTAVLERAVKRGNASSLEKLAELGNVAFHRLVEPESLRNLIVESCGSDDLDEAPPLRIDVTTSHCHCPWGLLYVGDPDDEVRPELFLGSAHVLNRLPHIEGFLDKRPAKLLDGRPRLCFASHSDLSHARDYEIPRVQQLGRGRSNLTRVDVDWLGFFDGNGGKGAAAEFRRRLKAAAAHIIHMACHGHSEDREAGRLVIDNEFEIDAYTFRRKGFGLKEAPVVFLNACDVGRPRPDTFANFADALFEAGARAVLAPECAVSDEQATYFAHAFYKYFVRQQRTIADAMWLAKRERLRRGDMGGLAYSLFGQPETFIAADAA